MGVPDCRGILERWTNIGLVSLRSDCGWASPEVPLEKASGAVSLLTDVINVWLPAQFALDGDA